MLTFTLFFSVSVALEEERNSPNNNSTGEHKGEALNTKQRHQMKHRELFLSRQLETLPATHIRGKCSVTLLNEEESLLSYLNKDVSYEMCSVFFYNYLYGNSMSRLIRSILLKHFPSFSRTTGHFFLLSRL